MTQNTWPKWVSKSWIKVYSLVYTHSAISCMSAKSSHQWARSECCCPINCFTQSNTQIWNDLHVWQTLRMGYFWLRKALLRANSSCQKGRFLVNIKSIIIEQTPWTISRCSIPLSILSARVFMTVSAMWFAWESNRSVDCIMKTNCPQYLVTQSKPGSMYRTVIAGL